MDRRRFLKETAGIVSGVAIAVGAGSDIADASVYSLRQQATSDNGEASSEEGPMIRLYLPRWKDDFARLDSDGKIRFDYRQAYERLAALRRRSDMVMVFLGNARKRHNHLDRKRVTNLCAYVRRDGIPNGDPFGQWLMTACEGLDFLVVSPSSVHTYDWIRAKQSA